SAYSTRRSEEVEATQSSYISRKPAADSCARARASRSAPQAGAASAPRRSPTNCTPIGKPDLDQASARLIAGWPVMFFSAVNGTYLTIGAQPFIRSFSSRLTVSPLVFVSVHHETKRAHARAMQVAPGPRAC